MGSGDPLPFRLLAGILGVLSIHDFHEEVLALALMFCCYLRPSEPLSFVEGDLLEPVANAGGALACWSLLLHPFEREEPTKVGQFDDSSRWTAATSPTWGPSSLACAAGFRRSGSSVSFRHSCCAAFRRPAVPRARGR